LVDEIAVIGLGYVGLPLAIAAAKAGFQVTGIDLDKNKINNIQNSFSNVEGIDNNDLDSLIKDGKLAVTNDFSRIKESKIVIVCVPTPLTLDEQPDLSFVIDATKQLSIHIKEDTLVIFESTVSTGTTRNILTPIITEVSKLSQDKFLVAFSPERIDPANLIWNVKNTPKLVAGLNEIASKRAADFYLKFIDKIEICKSLEIAETAKLLENSFRLINIAFINELAVFCNKQGVDILEVIKAANTKPYGFMPFYPSLGAGGHCIPVDPVYLSKVAALVGTPITILELAHDINVNTPKHFVKRVENEVGSLSKKRILVIGIAYKPNVADIRESAALNLILGLRKKGALTTWHDDLVNEWNGEKSAPLSADYDLAILATPHDYLDLTKLGNVPILNTRGSI